MKTCPPLFRSNLHLKTGWVNVFPPKLVPDEYIVGAGCYPDRDAAEDMVGGVRPLYRVKVTLHAG